jgi:hypothetical protein
VVNSAFSSAAANPGKRLARVSVISTIGADGVRRTQW